MNWYNKYNLQNKQGSLNCPSCDFNFDQKMVYFFEPNACPNCEANIGHLNVSPYNKVVYTIDLDNAPEIFDCLFSYLKEKDHKSGFNEVKELILMLMDK